MQYALQEFFRHEKDVAKTGLSAGLAGKRVIVQGLGNVGYHAALFLSQQDGCRITHVLERTGTVADPDGVDIEALGKHLRDSGDIAGFQGFTEDGAAILEADADILIPAAMEGVIGEHNAPRIRAPLIIEAANGPITAAADAILRASGTIIIPDLYANAGGVTVSYFEWIKNLTHIRFGRMQRRQSENQFQTLILSLIHI